jgi:hypothetical protein
MHYRFGRTRWALCHPGQPKREPGSYKTPAFASAMMPDKASPFRNLITRMFPLTEGIMKTLANFRSTVMAGLDPAIQT